MEGIPADAIWMDEAPLRKAVVKGYFGEKMVPMEPEPLIARLRDLLSGPAGGDCVPGTYFFETAPERLLPEFLAGLEAEKPGLAALVAKPILAAAAEVAEGRRGEIAPNLGAFISSLAGPMAVKARIAETTAAALLAGVLIAVSRLGVSRVQKLFA
jgi:hypothetical protein